MKKVILFLSLLALGSCQRQCTRMSRNVQVTERWYDVQTYSGGKLISHYQFMGMLNSQEHSDGYYFYRGDTLIEVSGDVIVQSLPNAPAQSFTILPR